MRRRGPLQRLANLAIARPWPVIAVSLLAVAVFGFAGKDAQKVIQPATLTIAGSESARATQLEQSRFKARESLAVMLRGSAKTLRHEGPKATRILNRFDGVKAVGPWNRGAPAWFLRGSGKTVDALLVLQVDRSFKETGGRLVPQLRTTLERELSPRVQSSVTGVSLFGAAINDEVLAATKRVELLCAPLLILILLAVFRSPLAAALPLVSGFSVILFASGAVTLLSRLLDLDSYAITGASFLGMALGIDYSLLMVSRFREELRRRRDAGGEVDIPTTVRAAVLSTGRTVVAAGVTVMIGIGLSSLIAPNATLFSISVGATIATMASVLLATAVLPALLTLLGTRINSWQLGRDRSNAKLAPAISRLISRPLLASMIVLVPLLAMSSLALGLKKGPPDGRTISKDNQVRKDWEAIGDRFGDGWATPFSLVIHSPKGPITKPRNLHAMANLQNKLAKDPDVAQVIGPAPLAKEVEGLNRIAKRATSYKSRLDRLTEGLYQASVGVRSLRRTLLASANRSGQVGASLATSAAQASAVTASLGSARASIALLQQGTGRAKRSSQALSTGLSKTTAAAASVAEKAQAAQASAARVTSVSNDFRQRIAQSKAAISKTQGIPQRTQEALQRANDALANLSLAAQSDPKVTQAIEEVTTALAAVKGVNPLNGQQIQQGYFGLSAAIDRAERESQTAIKNAGQLAEGARTLAGGLERLSAGNQRVAEGTAKASSGAARLSNAVDRVDSGSTRLRAGADQLSAGATKLQSGLDQLGKGNGQLGTGLREGYQRSAPLDRGLESASTQVAGFNETIEQLAGSSGQQNQEAQSGIEKTSESGYLALAALKGAPEEQQQSANLVVNGDAGGDTARLFVIPHENANEEGALRQRLKEHADELSQTTGSEALLSGPGAQLGDYRATANSKTAPTIALLSLVTLVFLLIVFRSPLLALKAVVLNLLVVGSAFGVIALIVNGPDPILDGPGFISSNVFFMVYAVVFTLSIDYEIFIINRMREAYFKTGSTEAAIRGGISNTAGVITGAAAVMVAVFGAFALFGIADIREMGITAAVAVIVDATLVRLILLPATMRLFGKANWWCPGWLERRLPRLGV